MQKFLFLIVLAIAVSASWSCNRNDSIVTPPSYEYPQGKIYFNPTNESGLASGLWMVELSANDTTVQLLIPDLYYTRISYNGTTLAGMKIVGHASYYALHSPGGNNLKNFYLDNWPSFYFLDPAPDGSRLVISAARFVAGSPAVFVVNSDGTGFHLLNDTTHDAYGWPVPAMNPTWSPDGSYIAYVRLYSYTDSTQAVLTVISPDGTNSRDLFRAYRLTVPMWSPDGQSIACFQGPRTIFELEPFSVRIINVSSGSSKLFVLVSSTPDPDYKSMAWSFDGTLFCSGASRDSDGVHSIYRISVSDPSSITKVADGFTRSTLICSPDGKYIAIVGNKGNDGLSLYIMKPDGSDLRLVKKLSSNVDCLSFGFRYGFWIPN